ncbi:DUF937 domain-containing protein [Oligoflexia bacterium]|nr:DUF937 domain-containing protein [Oligoflexia bacterium]
MNLLQSILEASGGTVVKQIANDFALSDSQTQSAIGQLLPALSRGLQNNMGSPQGLQGLLGALNSGKHQQYVEKQGSFLNKDTISDGNGILGHVLGSKDASRNVAGHAAKSTGIDAGILKKMLPVLATLAMGTLSKQAAQGQALNNPADSPQASAGMSMLTSFLDADKDGSVVDDVIGLAKRFF